jgi:hypothetical protein
MSDSSHDAAAKARSNLRKLPGRGGAADYLDVKWRITWLREDHPDADITTDIIELTDQRAVFKATIKLPNGGMATGYGSETPNDFKDYIEKAETKAIGRACNALGYGTPAAMEDDARIVDAPVEVVDRATGEITREPRTASATAKSVLAKVLAAAEPTDEIARQNVRSTVAPSPTSQPTGAAPNARPGPSRAQPAASSEPEMSPRQRNFLFALAGELTGIKGEDLDVELHRMVKARFGVESLSQLSKRQVTPYIDELQNEVNAKRRANRAPQPTPMVRASAGQAGDDRFTQ